MRGIAWKSIGLIVVLLTAAPWARAAQSLTDWRVCVGDIAVPPFVLATPGRLGTAERLAIEAGRAAGLNVSLLRLPHRRCQLMVESGEADAVFLSAVPRNLERYGFPMREGQVDAALRAARVRIIWVRRMDQSLSGEAAGLRVDGRPPAELLVGIRSGFRFGAAQAEQLGMKLDDSAFHATQLLRKLQARRFDVVMSIYEEVAPLLEQPEFGDLVAVSPPLLQLDYYLAVRRELPAAAQQRVRRWWQAIGRLRDASAVEPPQGDTGR